MLHLRNRYSYSDRQVLKNKNYTFKVDGKHSVMGESGNYKTTLTIIILGLLPDYSGKVLYGFREQIALRMENLYEHIAYVDQQT